MAHLTSWQEKIQAKRKQTTRDNFIHELVSRYPLMLYKREGQVSRYAQTERSPNLCSTKEFYENDNLVTKDFYDPKKGFFASWGELLKNIKLPYRSYF
jgi:hypothetical protein